MVRLSFSMSAIAFLTPKKMSMYVCMFSVHMYGGNSGKTLRELWRLRLCLSVRLYVTCTI